MYRKEDANQLKFENFYLPFGGKIRSDNRWVILSKQIPWQQIEEQYGELFCDDDGSPAISARMALGALIIKERLNISDRETVEQIIENPYLQYFLGYLQYDDAEPFHNSMMTHFRKRFSQDILAEVNEWIVKAALANQHQNAKENNAKKDSDKDNNQPPENKGKLIIDATCTPADIAYPTDLNILNEAREKTEEIIDAMHVPFIGIEQKPRTYRQKARKSYLSIVKSKKPTVKNIRRAISKQLGFLRRNLSIIDVMASKGRLMHLSKRQYRLLLIINEVFRQQQYMYSNDVRRIDDRIVSIYQPHVRPIVRGKAKSPVEFGAKVSISLIDGFSFVEKIGWDNYNESCDLKEQIETYRQRFGFYPESIHVDRIYQTAENRRFCKGNGIRISGPALGRRANDVEQLKCQRKVQYADEIYRISVEGKFGQAKRRFSLARIMAKLAITSEAVVMVSFIVMNLEKILGGIVSFFVFCVEYVSNLQNMRQYCCQELRGDKFCRRPTAA
ncbi:MAG: hypothetical protein BWY69_01712 [Planctomycetes bacterium ADurb.Bin401]|nr:MAG: hypothetical protein BWY69_01712 [Planctomycetes bacterium ADurb.Bin401]